MSSFLTIDTLSLSTVTGGAKPQQPAAPACPPAAPLINFAPQTKVTGVKSSKSPITISTDDHSQPRNKGFGSGARVEAGNPLPIGELT